MAIDLEVPPWLHQYILAWVDRLHLNDWTIKIEIALCVNEDADALALTQQYPDINTARLLFRADIDDTKDWRRTVIHELIHVSHSRIDHAVEDSLILQLPAAAHQLAFDSYHQQIESYTAFLADTLYRATAAIDYPSEV